VAEVAAAVRAAQLEVKTAVAEVRAATSAQDRCCSAADRSDHADQAKLPSLPALLSLRLPRAEPAARSALPQARALAPAA